MRKPVFKSSSSLILRHEYLAIETGGYLCMNKFRVSIAVFNVFQRNLHGTRVIDLPKSTE